MSQDLQHRYEWLKDEAQRISSERGVSLARAFAAWCLQFVCRLDLDDAVEQTAREELGVHGWFLDEEAGELQILACAWSDQADIIFGADSGEAVIAAMGKAFGAAKLSPAQMDLAAILRNGTERDYEVVLLVAVPTAFNKDAGGVLEASLIEFSKKNRCEATLRLLDSKGLEDLRYERNVIQESLRGTTVEFLLTGKTLELSAPTIPPGWSVALANLSGSSLAGVAETHGTKLFHMNVRFALPYQAKRVAGIRRTLASPTEATHFWLYNNGLTILCDGYKTVERGSGVVAMMIENPQIVNGCQTATAFKASASKCASLASVLARIIAPPKDQTEDQAYLISERTNSQTPVLARDLKANDRGQKLLKLAVQALAPAWFCELKRGEWAALPAADQSRYIGPEGKRLIDIEQLGQAFRMLHEPAEAIARKKDLFEVEGIYAAVFARGRAAEVYVFGEVLRQKYYRFWRKDNLAEIIAVCGGAYNEVLLNRLMRAKNQVVSHSVALTARLFDWSPDWDRDRSKAALSTVLSSRFDVRPWLGHIGMGLAGMVEMLDEANEQASQKDPTTALEPINIKKYFERPGQKTIADLWKRVSGNAQLLIGANWRNHVMRQVLP